MSAAEFVPWAIEALIASTLLMGFVLLVRKPAQRALGPQLAYWLWALPVLRLVTPPLPTGWRDHVAAPLSAASETMLVFMAPVANAAAPDPVAAPIPWLALFTAAWTLGALFFFGWHGLSHFAYVRRIVSPPATHQPLADGTTLVESEEAIGPVAFGVLKRFVAVPRDFAERYDADERRLALAHELGHHARGDLIANWIALGVLAVHWFNPLAWVAYRKFRTDQELANDARVLAALPPVERHAYACAILKAAHGRAITAACHLHTIEDLKGRLRMLKASRKSRRVLLAGATGIAALTVAGLGLTASGAAAEKIRTVAAVQAVAMTQPVAPVAPVPPVTPVPDVKRVKKIVLVRDGKTETYEGADAEAFIASHPEFTASGGKTIRRQRIVIRSKDGKTETYEGADADAYLKAHPEMRPPAPPAPPVGAIGAVPPPPPPPGAWGTATSGSRVFVRRSDGKMPQSFVVNMPDVVDGDCPGRDETGFVRSEQKDGKQRMIICRKRIERFAADQARTGMVQARMGIATARRAILAERNLTEDQRRQALAGLDQAQAEIDQQMAEQTKGR